MVKIIKIDKEVSERLDIIYSNYPQRVFTKHQIEEMAYRLYLCKDCFSKKCPYCGCDPLDTAVDYISCNKEEKFPNRHRTEADWEKFKKQNNIIIT